MSSPRALAVLAAALFFVLGFSSARGADDEKPAAPKRNKPTVAVLDFESGDTANKLGKQIPEALSALLSDDDEIEMVERAQVSKAVTEQAVGLTGLTDSEKSIRIGKIVGAQILITGKTFIMDKDTYLVAKIMGAETLYVKTVMVKDSTDKDIGELVTQLAQKIIEKLQMSDLLLAHGTQPDPIQDLKARLGKLKRPAITVSVSERHESHRTGQLVDPAAEIEIKKNLNECGFQVIEDEEKSRQKPGLEVKGEAFSELGSLIGNLTTCSARLEVKVIDPESGTLIFDDSTVARGVDLSEAIAAKTALQKAAHTMSINILNRLATTLPSAKAK